MARKNREGSDMPSPANHREYNLTSTQADQARGDFSVILDELDLAKWQLERLPIRLFLSDVTIGHGERVGSARVSRIVAGAASPPPSPLAVALSPARSQPALPPASGPGTPPTPPFPMDPVL